MKRIKAFFFKLAFFSVFLMVFPAVVFARGEREVPMVILTIVNNTNALITEIKITELSPNKNLPVIVRNLENNTSTNIMLRQGVNHNIILIDTNGREYKKERRGWDVPEATLSFRRNHIVNRNLWDSVRRVLFWPAYL